MQGAPVLVTVLLPPYSSPFFSTLNFESASYAAVVGLLSQKPSGLRTAAVNVVLQRIANCNCLRGKRKVACLPENHVQIVLSL